MKWEYLIAILPFEEIDEAQRVLDRHGRDGWELVAVIPKVGAGKSWSQAFLRRPLPN